MSNREGQQFGNYKLIRYLGHGTFADVYLGQHVLLGTLAALKMLRISLDQEREEEFLQEARMLAQLDHPHIVSVLDFFVEQEARTPVLAMKYAVGGTMRQHCPVGTRLPLATVVAFIQQIADALQYAHNKGIIHRDVKPDNILLSVNQQLQLSDFGLAMLVSSNGEQRSAGTIPYMAPEQALKRPMFASDQYALAIIAYEWLCGRRPFTGSGLMMMRQHQLASPPSMREFNPAIPTAVEEVVLKALSKEPRDRYVSVRNFARALQRAYVSSTSYTTDDSQITDSFKAIIRPPLARQASAPPPALSRELLNRKLLLDRVHDIWIKGGLEQSLHGRAHIALGLGDKPDAIADPWGLVLRSPQTTPYPLPSGTHVIQAYDDANGELLILGEPGAGKSTLLQELARDLLARARLDQFHPLPVIFNLSSWADKQLPIADWLVEELHVKYLVPYKLGQTWVADNQILPLLDGFDEIAVPHRAACIEALYAYKRQYGIPSLVMCSRTTDYAAQPVRIFLRKAVVIQPLTKQQIHAYLDSAGEQLAALRTAMDNDSALLELATSPLMLNILTLSYYETSGQVSIEGKSPEEQRKHIFDTYIKHMLKIQRGKIQYSPEKITRHLSFLAQQMTQHNQTEFYLERMQPDWLSKGWMRFLYTITVRVGIGLCSGLVCLFTGGLVMELALNSWLIGLIFGGVFGLMFSLVFALTSWVSDTIVPAERIRWSWEIMWQEFVKGELKSALLRIFPGGLLCAVLGIVLFLLLSGGGDVVAQNFAIPLRILVLEIGVICGSMGILLFSLFHEFAEELPHLGADIQLHLMPRKKPGSPLFPKLLAGPFFGLVCGLVFTLIFSLVFMRLLGWRNGLLAGLILGSVNGLFFGLTGQVQTKVKFTQILRRLGGHVWQKVLRTEQRNTLGIGLGTWLFIYGLSFRFGSVGPLHTLSIACLAMVVVRLLMGIVSGLSSDMVEKHTFMTPGQGIRSSARNSALVGLIFGIIGAVLLGLITWAEWVVQGSQMNLPILLFFMLIGGVVCGGLAIALPYGGIACIQYVVLRFFLWASRKTPWRYVRFLDHAADRILLRKVGGGYTFIHRFLLEHFAAMVKEKSFNMHTSQQAPSMPFAFAYADLPKDGYTIVGKTYTLQAGITPNVIDGPEDLQDTSSGTTSPNQSSLQLFAIVIHPSEEVELKEAGYQLLRYNIQNPQPQFIRCPFQLQAAGQRYILVTFYWERQWLATLRLEFDGIEQSTLASRIYGA